MHAEFLFIGAFLGAVTFAVHFFVGGKYVATPLLNSTCLPPASKWLNYFCWHVVSVLLLLEIAAFAWTATHPPGVELVIFLTALNISAALLSITAAILGKIAPWKFPSSTLFTLLSITGVLALSL